jgi:osmoprotectant transport system substrate-binding protein
MRTPAIVLAAVACAVAGCGSGGGGSGVGGARAGAGGGGEPGKGKPPVILATKNFTEQYVLGELYSQALEARGFTIVLKKNVGSSEIVDRALADGVIDAYPEYIGVIAQELAQAKQRPKSERETYARAQAYEEKRGFTILRATPGFDADANAVRPDVARRYRLKSTADLKRLGSFTYGGPPENQTRFQGAVGMRQVYGLDKLVYVPLTIERRYPALDSGRIDVAAVFTTEGQLTQRSKYVLLSDPKGIFGFQNIVPVVSKKVLRRQGPAFEAVLNAVSAKLTNDALQTMNAAVDLQKHKPADVARRFLLRNGLL